MAKQLPTNGATGQAQELRTPKAGEVKGLYQSPEVRQVGTLEQMQGCKCGVSCDCAGYYIWK